MTEKIKILFLSASPLDFAPLRLDEEMREIDKKIQTGSQRSSFQLILQPAARWDDLQEALLRHKPHIVHFSGHGSKAEEISVIDDSGASQPVDKESLVELFDILRDKVRIVLLNACYSKPQAEAISQIIDYTIGMNKAIGDKAAIAFAGAFYRALSFDRSVREAFRLGRNKLRGAGLSGADTPELICRAEVNPAEPFLRQKQLIRGDYADDLKSAITHLAAGEFDEDEQQLVRTAFGTRIIFQPDDTVERGGEVGERLRITAYKSAVYIKGDAQDLRSLQEKINPSPPGILPAALNLVFLGREDSLGEVKDSLGVYEAPPPENGLTVVHGVPGVGKGNSAPVSRVAVLSSE